MFIRGLFNYQKIWLTWVLGQSNNMTSDSNRRNNIRSIVPIMSHQVLASDIGCLQNFNSVNYPNMFHSDQNAEILPNNQSPISIQKTQTYRFIELLFRHICFHLAKTCVKRPNLFKTIPFLILAITLIGPFFDTTHGFRKFMQFKPEKFLRLIGSPIGPVASTVHDCYLATSNFPNSISENKLIRHNHFNKNLPHMFAIVITPR